MAIRNLKNRERYPESEDPRCFNAIGRTGITIRNLKNRDRYPESEDPRCFNAIGRTAMVIGNLKERDLNDAIFLIRIVTGAANLHFSES